MSNTVPLVVLTKPCSQAVNWAISRLEPAGFQAVRTFDLQAARSAHLDCPCPQHGSAHCHCQMVVLLVYQAETPPATLVIHGNDQKSWLYLTNAPGVSAGQSLENRLQEVFSLEINPSR